MACAECGRSEETERKAAGARGFAGRAAGKAAGRIAEGTAQEEAVEEVAEQVAEIDAEIVVEAAEAAEAGGQSFWGVKSECWVGGRYQLSSTTIKARVAWTRAAWDGELGRGWRRVAAGGDGRRRREVKRNARLVDFWAAGGFTLG